MDSDVDKIFKVRDMHMNQIIREVIEKVYVRHDFEFFISSCAKKNRFIDELLKKLKVKCEKVEIHSSALEPAFEIRLTVNTTSPKEIKIVYTSILTISKIVDCFYLQHEFELENPDMDRMDYYLDSFRDEPYNKQQFRIEEIIIDFLKNEGYFRLSYSETEEICPQIRKFRDKQDSQMTVGNAIFMDFWGLCNE